VWIKAQKQVLTRKSSSQFGTKRVQILSCEYWEQVKNIDPDNLVFLD
jgi:hypothetical protein